jgi:outer membrane protein OmpA-like peptidoglycan-associated protein
MTLPQDKPQDKQPSDQYLQQAIRHTHPLASSLSNQAGMSQNGILGLVIGAILVVSAAGALWKKNQVDEQHQQPAMALPSASQGNNNASVNPVTKQIVYPARLSIVTDSTGKLMGCSGAVGNQTTARLINERVDNIYTQTADRCRLLVDPAYNTQLMDMDMLDHLLQVVRGIPDTMMAINYDEFLPETALGNTQGSIVVNTANAANLATIQKGLADQVGSQFAVTALVVVDEKAEAQRSIQRAMQMLDTMPSTGIRPIDIARILNTQIINFDFNQTIIPNINKPVLDRVAPLMASTPNLMVEIHGFTDSVDTDQYNMELSQQRAEAVRDYLLSKGVPANRMNAMGMGEHQPVADNATAQGRFRNRRIEFWVVNTATGQSYDVTPATVPSSETQVVVDTNTVTVEPPK